jgi:hypothetical protein
MAPPHGLTHHYRALALQNTFRAENSVRFAYRPQGIIK